MKNTTQKIINNNVNVKGRATLTLCTIIRVMDRKNKITMNDLYYPWIDLNELVNSF